VDETHLISTVLTSSFSPWFSNCPSVMRCLISSCQRN